MTNNTAVNNEVKTNKKDEFVSLDFALKMSSEALESVVQDTIEARKLGGKLPISSLDNPTYKKVKKDCVKMEPTGKNGRLQPQIDDDKLMVLVVVEAVDRDTRSDFTFKNPQLLEKLGVVSAAAACEKLLDPGEIMKAAMKVQDISGFTEDAAEERAEEVKNS
ncbi:phage tail assembly chaperone [Metabacillus fastidiosus]|uniref:phage tail assembly chaperone n=1 Tax=Metabacillus fastidiosus TaxID=1458 RepID=UPI003D2E3875